MKTTLPVALPAVDDIEALWNLLTAAEVYGAVEELVDNGTVPAP